MEIEEVAPAAAHTRNNSRLTPMGNIYRSSFPSRAAKIHNKIRRSLSSLPSEKKSSESEDLGSMTAKFLRARLITERATAESAKSQIDELQRKVHELERRLASEIERRKDAETALQEALEGVLHGSCSSGSSEDTDTELENFSRAALSEDSRSYEDSMSRGSSMRYELPREPEVRKNSTQTEIQENQAGDRGNVRSIHSDSDYDGKSSETRVVHSAARLKSLDSESGGEENGRQLCLKLREVDVANISKHQNRKNISGKSSSAVKPEMSQEAAMSELTGWVNYVVNMLEARAHVNPEQSLNGAYKRSPRSKRLHASKPEEHTSNEPKKKSKKLRNQPYVSFAKYLGLKNLHKLIEMQRDKDGVMIWRIKSFSELQQQGILVAAKPEESSSQKNSAISLEIPLKNDVEKKEMAVCRHHVNLQLDIGIKSVGTPGTKEKQDVVVSDGPRAAADTKAYDVEVSENSDFICMDISYKDGSLLENKAATLEPASSASTEKLRSPNGKANSVEQANNKCQSKLLEKLGCFSSNEDKGGEGTSSRTGGESKTTADEKIDEIFKALNAAKQQLKNSIERRHQLETEFRTSRSNSRSFRSKSSQQLKEV